MKITIECVREECKAANDRRGINNPAWNVVGSIGIGGDICGLSVDEVVNVHGGIRRHGYGLTKREAYDILINL